jgi:secreted Zn-dependent insulinase-like peptidase
VGNYVDNKCIFSIDMILSPHGCKNRNMIIKIIFDYIDMLKQKIHEPEMKKLYDEILLSDEYGFKYSEKDSPEDKCISYHNLITTFKIPLCYILAIKYVHDKFKNIKKNLLIVLNQMNLNNLVIIVGSSEFSNEILQEDENYGTKFNITNDKIVLKELTEITKCNLPVENTYISVDDFIPQTDCKIPKLIRNDRVKLFYFPSNEFKNPEACIRVKIDMPLSLINKEIYTKTLLYFNSIISEINDEKYLCHMAGYKIHVIYDMGKLLINIQGNYGKIDKVCNFIVNSLMDGSIVSDKSFEKTKFVLSNSDKNMAFNPPYTRIASFFTKKICPKFYDNYDRLRVIDSLFKSNTMNCISNILKTSLVTVSVIGNAAEDLAKKIGSIFEVFVPENIYHPDTFVCDIYGTPSNCIETLHYPVENKHEVNSVVGYYIFIGKIKYGVTENWNRSVCLLNVLNKIIGTEYFDQLRTQEKFGYVVSSSIHDVGDKRLLSKYYKFVVQSPNKKPDEIVKRTTNFIDTFKKNLHNLSSDEFSKIVKGCITALMMEYNNLDEMASFVNLQIDTEYLTFDLKNVLVQTYSELTKDDLLDFYEEKFINKKAIIVCLDGNEKY